MALMWRVERPLVDENAVRFIPLEFRSDIGDRKDTALGKTPWVFRFMGVDLLDVLFQVGHGCTWDCGVNRLRTGGGHQGSKSASVLCQ